MPMFFMISGFVAGYSLSSLKKNWIKSSQQLLLPYLVWTIAMCATMRLNFWDVCIIHPRYWFLLVLFVVRLSHAVCLSIARRTGIGEGMALTFVTALLAVLHYVLKFDVLCVHIYFYYMLFYGLGYFLFKHASSVTPHLRSMPFMLSSLLVFGVWGYFFTRGVIPIAVRFVPGFLYTAPLALIGSLLYFSLFMKYLDNDTRMLAWFGKNSLGVYVVSGLLFNLLSCYVKPLVVLTMQNELCLYTLFVIISIASGIVVWMLSASSFLRLSVGLKKL